VKVPESAFETYVAMGPNRSYQALAKKLGVDKRSIVRMATKEMWASRLTTIQGEARRATDKKLVGELQAVREQQLREVRFLRAEALKAMKGLTPEKAVRIAAALNIAWKHELLLLGEPAEQTELPELLRNAHERWLKRNWR
jgi:hypothetical protein